MRSGTETEIETVRDSQQTLGNDDRPTGEYFFTRYYLKIDLFRYTNVGH
jgi:hypothetical protein